MVRGFLVGAGFLLVGLAIGYNVTPTSTAGAYRQEVNQTLYESRTQPSFMARAKFRQIFLNNVRIAAGAELGFVTFGAFGACLLTVNGIKMGILYRTALADGVPSTVWLMHVLPHGIIEYIALLLAEAVAIEWGRLLWKQLTGKPSKLNVNLMLVTVACFPIVALAAWLEVYVTPFL